MRDPDKKHRFMLFLENYKIHDNTKIWYQKL